MNLHKSLLYTIEVGIQSNSEHWDFQAPDWSKWSIMTTPTNQEPY